MSARQRILERLRQAPVQTIAAPEIAAGAPAPATPAEALQRLAQNLEAAHAEVIDGRATDWRHRLREICAAKGIRTLMLPAAGIALSAWAGGPQLRRFDRAIEAHKDALFGEIDAGLTLADAAIVDPALLVLVASPTQPRTLSLVPPIHICLVAVDRLDPDLGTALRENNWAAAMPSNLIFISGPSKTADIQQTLAYGAHGPKALIVVLVNDRKAVQ